MANFGWSYPPGCTSLPWDDADEGSEESWKIQEILEDAEAPNSVIDKVQEQVSLLESKILGYERYINPEALRNKLKAIRNYAGIQDRTWESVVKDLEEWLDW